MWKVIGGVAVGVFVGAVAFEILSRTRPELILGLEEKARRAVQAAIDAFERGYKSPRSVGEGERA